MALSCSICDNPRLKSIDAVLATGAVSLRNMAQQFGISAAALFRHKRDGHIGQRIKAAMDRAGRDSDDVFMQRHEHLYSETLQYVEDAKKAVKMQRVTVERENEAGILEQREVYQSFRDVGAMAPALQTAVALQRVLGDATGRFANVQIGAQNNLYLAVVLPRQVSGTVQAEQPVIDVKVEDGASD